MASSDDEDFLDSDDRSVTDIDSDMSEGEYCVVLDDVSAADLHADMSEEEDCCDLDDRDMLENWTWTSTSPYRPLTNGS